MSLLEDLARFTPVKRSQGRPRAPHNSLPDLIKTYLRDGPQDTFAIAEAIRSTHGVTRTTLARLRRYGEVDRVGYRDGRVSIWKLL